MKNNFNESIPLSREFLSDIYISGNGIEIGALHAPLPVNKTKATVKYVDHMDVEGLRKHYPELNGLNLVAVDYIANGELLESINDSSQDFVIANHFLEHCQNPILTIKNMLRVLKPGGVIFLAVPDKRFTFDELRPVTTIAHVVEDFENGPEVSKKQHYKEWTVLVNKIQGDDLVVEETARLLSTNYSIHFHVWEKKDMDEFLVFLIKRMAFDFEIALSLRREHSNENIFILKKNTAQD